MATISLKCHLCGTYLQELIPVENLGKNKRIPFVCIDRICRSLQLHNQCRIEVISPEGTIVGYNYVLQENNAWYRVSALDSDSYKKTWFSVIRMLPLSGAYLEENLLIISNFYKIDPNDDLKKKFRKIVQRLKNLVVFS